MADNESAGGNDVVTVGRAVRASLELKASPGCHIGPGSQRPMALAAADQFVQPQSGDVVSIVTVKVAARKLKSFEVCEFMGIGLALVGNKLLADRLEIVVARGKLSSVELADADPAGDFGRARFASTSGCKAQRVGHWELVVRQKAGV